MNFLRTLFLLVAGLSVAWCGPRAQIQPIGLTQFRKMMLCTMPFSWPIFDYAVYGCYCGKSTGGSGTPVDELDRCCQVHDKCYGDAKQLKECWSIIHNHYFMYTYRCVKHSKTLTCGENNNVCEMFLCECDRKAAECFARSTYHPENKRLPQGKCQTNMVKA